MICDSCVFHKEIAERGQDFCGKRDDPVAAIRACLNADMCGACFDFTTVRDVRALVESVKKIEAERDEALRTVAKIDGYIAAMSRLVSELNTGGKKDEKKIGDCNTCAGDLTGGV